jgi:predicted transcriptional regulator
MNLTDAEWRVMNEVWRWPEVTARQVHTALAEESGWAYSTVKTLLARLVEKGAVEARREGKQSVFRAVVEQESARTEAAEGLLDRVFGGAVGGLFQHLIGSGKLSRRDRAEVRALLDRAEKRGGRKG